MSNREHFDSFTDRITASPKGMIVIGILAILLGGVFGVLASQQDPGYLFIGGLVFVAGVGAILLAIGMVRSRRKEAAMREEKESRRERGEYDIALRPANTSVKSKILLEATVGKYVICYRRVKSVNELVINGDVYDERKGILEFEHTLSAVIDGHRIEAGLRNEGYSFISFDGKRIARKKRVI